MERGHAVCICNVESSAQGGTCRNKMAALIETAASAEIYLVRESCKSEAGDSDWTALVLSRNRSSRRRTALTSESDCHISRKSWRWTCGQRVILWGMFPVPFWGLFSLGFAWLQRRDSTDLSNCSFPIISKDADLEHTPGCFSFFLTSVFEDGNLYIASQKESKVTQDCTSDIYYIVLVTSLKK